MMFPLERLSIDSTFYLIPPLLLFSLPRFLPMELVLMWVFVSVLRLYFCSEVEVELLAEAVQSRYHMY